MRPANYRGDMTVDANARQGVRVAPDGLNFVQAFLNTEGGGRSDLLADAATANAWYASAYLALARERFTADAGQPPPTTLSERDTARLVVLRSRLKQALKGHAEPLGTIIPAITVSLRQSNDMTVLGMPRGSGWQQAASLLAYECLVAQLTGNWPRLKICRDEGCKVAFYDRSRNNSGVWHDVHICGNAANLRASRARRRNSRTGSSRTPGTTP